MIEAKTWRQMEIRDILSSIEVAVAILEERDISDHLSEIAHIAFLLNGLLAETLDVLETERRRK